MSDLTITWSWYGDGTCVIRDKVGGGCKPADYYAREMIREIERLRAEFAAAERDARRLDWLEASIRDGSYQTIIHDLAAICHHAYKAFGNGPALRTAFDGLMATAEDGAAAIRALAHRAQEGGE